MHFHAAPSASSTTPTPSTTTNVQLVELLAEARVRGFDEQARRQHDELQHKMAHLAYRLAGGPDLAEQSEELGELLASAVNGSGPSSWDQDRVGDGGVITPATRTAIRYLAALFPYESDLMRLADKIHYVLYGGRTFPMGVTDVFLTLRGHAHELSIGTIQSVGAGLAAGVKIRQLAPQLGVARSTVADIDRFCGITQARKDRLLDDAITFLREGMSVRAFARHHSLPVSTAGDLYVKAREVLAELGEVPAP